MLSPLEQSIKSKIEAKGTPLGEWDIQINRGILTGYNKAFIIDQKTRDQLIKASPESEEIIRPILRGRDIIKYGCKWANLWLINSHNGLKSANRPPVDIAKNYPTIFTHLKQYQNKLENRADKGDSWYNLRNCAYSDVFENEKIIYPETMRFHKNNPTAFPRFSYDKGTYHCDKTVFMITGHKLKVILGFLNSKLMEFLIPKTFIAWDDSGFMIQKNNMETVPIPELTMEQEAAITVLVNQILETTDNKLRISLQEKIDDICFKAINLNTHQIEYIKNYGGCKINSV